jgi:outer membrane receptor protein involved in Fe transport
VSYTASFKVQTLPKTAFVDYIGTNTIVGATPAGPHPEWKALTTFGYRLGAVDVGMRWRYLDGMKDVSVITTPSKPSAGVPTYQLIDLFGTYNLNAKWQLRAGVTNLFDHDLPVVASSQVSTDPSTYDAIGRSFYVGLKAAF